MAYDYVSHAYADEGAGAYQHATAGSMTRALRTDKRSRSWSGTAAVFEAIILLVVIMAVLAVLVQTFAAANALSQQSEQLTLATQLAITTAEDFSANPQTVAATQEVSGLLVSCDITTESTTGGIIYHAHITVTSTSKSDEIYSVDTERYVSSDFGRGGDSA